MKEWSWYCVNPISNIEKSKPPKHRNRLISHDEIKIILRDLNYIDGMPVKDTKQEIAYAFLIAIETAMRKGEILSLTYNNLFLEYRFVHLDKTKNGDARDVQLSNRAIYLSSY